MAVELHSDPQILEGIKLETASMQLRYSSPIARYREIAAEFVLSFVNPIALLRPLRESLRIENGVDKV